MIFWVCQGVLYPSHHSEPPSIGFGAVLAYIFTNLLCKKKKMSSKSVLAFKSVIIYKKKEKKGNLRGGNI